MCSSLRELEIHKLENLQLKGFQLDAVFPKGTGVLKVISNFASHLEIEIKLDSEQVTEGALVYFFDRTGAHEYCLKFIPLSKTKTFQSNYNSGLLQLTNCTEFDKVNFQKYPDIQSIRIVYDNSQGTLSWGSKTIYFINFPSQLKSFYADFTDCPKPRIEISLVFNAGDCITLESFEFIEGEHRNLIKVMFTPSVQPCPMKVMKSDFLAYTEGGIQTCLNKWNSNLERLSIDASILDYMNLTDKWDVLKKNDFSMCSSLRELEIHIFKDPQLEYLQSKYFRLEAVFPKGNRVLKVISNFISHLEIKIKLNPEQVTEGALVYYFDYTGTNEYCLNFIPLLKTKTSQKRWFNSGLFSSSTPDSCN